ncbi:aldehyde dehydrogenase family protein [Stieleria sp. JC731]|uniref:aldehyde dehydrogenase family protein n=1 Tax=Pirellulaceae TaxID=2691357 RepID=UPI001E4E2DDE|nr:aldehyde dehydrogenase family protein [Stieleria sp. JC731]MCC9599657.1 aldehyde dehydrogenase family protein [Stieleria sp. JC731]
MSESQASVPLVKHWIGGEYQSSSVSEHFVSFDPETDQQLCKVCCGTVAEVDAAVQAAATAQERSSGLGPSQREAILLRAADLLLRDQDQFIDLLIREIGSPISKAKMEIGIAARVLRANASMARRMTGRTYQSDIAGRMSLAIREPLGVVAGITPFNVPLIKAIKHSSLPLATGNGFVLLPSPQSPMVADRVAKLYADAGLPPGLMNVVFGIGGQIGPALVRHPLVQAVSFTGSAKVGQQVQADCGQFRKRVTLELGGKNPILILSDADLQKAIPAAVRGGFIYQGQICMASSRVIIERGLMDAFVEKFVAAVQKLPQGDLHDPATVIGPVISKAARQRIDDHIADAYRNGASVLCGNQWTGNRLNPTVLSGVKETMRLYREETFGPVVTIEAADDEGHALQLAHAGSAMLSAAIFTQNIDRAFWLARSLRCGMVHVNDMTIQQEPDVPFGGDGDAGFGREGMETGIEDYTKWKWITVNGPSPSI